MTVVDDHPNLSGQARGASIAGRFGSGACVLLLLGVGLWPTTAAADVTMHADGGALIVTPIPPVGDTPATFIAPANTVDATLRIWPRSGSSCGAAPSEGRQVYNLPLAITGAPDALRGQTVIPHLQVATTFCLELTWHRAATPENEATRAVVRTHLQLLPRSPDDNALRQLAQDIEREVCTNVGAAGCSTLDTRTLGDIFVVLYLRLPWLALATEEPAVRTYLADQNADPVVAAARSEAITALYDQTVDTLLRAVLDWTTLHVRTSFEANATCASRTSNIDNYVSADAGFAVGWAPLAPTAAWALFYIGVNLYVSPVDRDIAIDELVGDFGTIFSQIFSLTLAYAGTDTAPHLGSVDIHSPLGGLPGVGIGARILPYIRASFLVFLFEAVSPNPLSDSSVFTAATTFSVSVDADIATLVSKIFAGH